MPLILKTRELNIHLFLLALLHRLQLTEVSRQQIEEELSATNKERADVIEQFQQVRYQTFKNTSFRSISN